MMPEQQTPFSKDFLVHDQDTRLEYEVFHGFGEPRVGFVTGYHGQEYGVIGRLRSMLNRGIITGKLQHSHIRVFHAHPEAIRSRTREANGVDINREFPVPGEMPTYPQARLLRMVTDQFPLQYVFSFHEDNVAIPHPFYFYDIPQHTHDTVMEERVERLRNGLITGIKQLIPESMYTGRDDLDNWIEDGYVLTPADNYDATFETHMVDLGARGLSTVQRSFVFEVPGHESVDIKQKYVGLILDKFVLPFISETLPIRETH